MPRRIHVPHVHAGDLTLDEREAHHLRNVLRLKPGTQVEVFDDAGNIGAARLDRVSEQQVTVHVEALRPRSPEPLRLIVASAVPKAARSDWLVEKLSELGVDTFIPLATERSVVLPEGKNKLDRWQRLAAEAAKQSHRTGVMRILPLTPLAQAIHDAQALGEGYFFSTAPDAPPLRQIIPTLSPQTLTLFIGPEGGWSPDELDQFTHAGLIGLSLTQTILRIETAAIAAAAIIATMLSVSPHEK